MLNVEEVSYFLLLAWRHSIRYSHFEHPKPLSARRIDIPTLRLTHFSDNLCLERVMAEATLEELSRISKPTGARNSHSDAAITGGGYGCKPIRVRFRAQLPFPRT